MNEEIKVSVDRELLDKVMAITHAQTPDEAIEEGLSVISAAAWLEGYWDPSRARMSRQEIKDSFAADYDPDEPYGHNAQRELAHATS